jgi:DNA end-binding protein Ku
MKTNRPARPYWTGFLKLSLVTCGVRLYTASTEAEKIKFNEIHGPSGERVRRQLHVPGIGEVERADIVKGFEFEKGRYVTVDPEDLKRLKLDSTDCIDITEFVDEIDPIYYDAPYYLLPEGGASEHGYRVIHAALQASGKVGIGQVVIATHERIVAIRAVDCGLLVNTLRYPSEIRDPADYYPEDDTEVDAEEVAMMGQIIARKSVEFAPEKFVDHYQTAVRELIDAKLAGELPEVVAKQAAPVGNLMDALKASLEQDDEPAPKPRPRPPAKVKPRGKVSDPLKV